MAIFHSEVSYFMFILWPICLTWYQATVLSDFMATATHTSCGIVFFVLSTFFIGWYLSVTSKIPKTGPRKLSVSQSSLLRVPVNGEAKNMAVAIFGLEFPTWSHLHGLDFEICMPQVPVTEEEAIIIQFSVLYISKGIHQERSAKMAATIFGLKSLTLTWPRFWNIL